MVNCILVVVARKVVVKECGVVVEWLREKEGSQAVRRPPAALVEGRKVKEVECGAGRKVATLKRSMVVSLVGQWW